MSWQEKCDNKELRVVETKTKQIIGKLRKIGAARLETGMLIMEIQQMLEPKRVFVAYLTEQFGKDVTTAYRYLKDAHIAKQLPAPVVEVAMEEGIERFDPVAIAQYEVPGAKASRETVVQYLRTVEKKRKPRTEPEALDMAASVEACVGYVDRVAANFEGAARKRFMKALCARLVES